MYYQQGDVIIKKIDRLPKGRKKQNHLILARGETTGHRHEVFGLADLYALDENLFLKVIEKAEIRHEEHLPIQLPPGIYQIGIVREYDHFEEEVRKVVD